MLLRHAGVVEDLSGSVGVAASVKKGASACLGRPSPQEDESSRQGLEVHIALYYHVVTQSHCRIVAKLSFRVARVRTARIVVCDNLVEQRKNLIPRLLHCALTAKYGKTVD